MADAKVSGVALGAIAAGLLLTYAGITGRNIPQAIQAVVQGKSPKTASVTEPIVSASSSGSAGTSSGSGGPHPKPGSNPSKTFVIQAVLSGLGAPATSANVSGMESWYGHENDVWPPAAQCNPWNTTLTEPGSWPLAGNSAGVQNYPDWNTGIEATVATLQGYGQIVGDLLAGTGLCDPQLASEFLEWSGNGYSSVC